MSTRREKHAQSVARAAFDAALSAIGQPLLADNPSFAAEERFGGVYPSIRLQKPGAAPLRFVFGPSFDVWVGPFSEVILLEVASVEPDQLRDQIVRVLQSSVSVRRRRWATTIEFRLGSEKPWLKFRDLGRGEDGAGITEFESYA